MTQFNAVELFNKNLTDALIPVLLFYKQDFDVIGAFVGGQQHPDGCILIQGQNTEIRIREELIISVCRVWGFVLVFEVGGYSRQGKLVVEQSGREVDDGLPYPLNLMKPVENV
ncbi:hypothetical protein PAERUG_E6_London_17_VIM_2_12_12_03648 [Pseudomonas aeruginosa]|nr:hypothetical protein PAERUG_E6_London_17_VIM_2_12_12_03648 [Pseudomonas aeruginosa]